MKLGHGGIAALVVLAMVAALAAIIGVTTRGQSETPRTGDRSAAAEREPGSSRVLEVVAQDEIPEDLGLGRRPLTKLEYEVLVNALYVRITTLALTEYADAEPGSPEMEEALEENERFVARLEQIEPPADIASAHETYVDVYRSVPRIAELAEGADDDRGGAGDLMLSLRMVREFGALAVRSEFAGRKFQREGYVVAPYAIQDMADGAKRAMLDKLVRRLERE